jgi:hypothetical protein
VPTLSASAALVLFHFAWRFLGDFGLSINIIARKLPRKVPERSNPSGAFVVTGLMERQIEVFRKDSGAHT